jgi:predicted nucleic acid-binding protein
MTLIERLRAAMKDTTSRAIHPLLAEIMDQLVVDDSLAKNMAEVYHAAHSDLENLKVSSSRTRNINRLLLAAAAICNVHGYGFFNVKTDRSRTADKETDVCGCGGMMIHYDRMDINKPPKGVDLVKCPNCGEPAKLVPGPDANTYIHSEDVLSSGTRPRHRCMPSHDGLRMDVIMPVLPTQEKDS